MHSEDHVWNEVLMRIFLSIFFVYLTVMTNKSNNFLNKQLNYGIETSYDMFLKLLYEGHKVGENYHPYDCFNFFVTAWHLFNDWLDKDPQRPKFALEKKGRTHSEMLDLLYAFRDLSNGSKHMLLKKSAFKKRKVAKVFSPIIGDWRAFFTNTPQIYIWVGESIYSMWDIRYLTTHYFSWLFDDSISPQKFPNVIVDHLKRCTI